MDIRRKKVINASVRESISRLLDQARKAYEKGSEPRSRRYVKMALDLMKKNKVRLPKEARNSFCRKCATIWIPGKTMTAHYDSRNSCLRATCGCGFTKRI